MVSLIITELPYLRLNKIIREQSVIIHLLNIYYILKASLTLLQGTNIKTRDKMGKNIIPSGIDSSRNSKRFR